MGIWDSFKRYLVTGIWSASVPEEGRAALPVSSPLMPSGGPEWAMVDVKTFVREGHRKNALIYACIEYVAREAALAVLKGYRRTESGREELPPLDPLALLLERPSAEYPSQTRWMRQIVRSLMVSGEAIIYLARERRGGAVVEMQHLPSDAVAVERSADGERRYLYRYDPARDPLALDEQDVLFVKFDDSLNPERGLPPLAAAAREGDVDNDIASYRKSFFQHGALPLGILTTREEVSEEVLQSWSASFSRFYAGPHRAGRVPALAGGLEFQEVGSTPDKAALPDVSALTEARICSVFGVPPILIGAKVGLDRSTYANYDRAYRAFWQDTVSPLLDFLADEFTGALTEGGDGRFCAFDTSAVPAMQEDADAKEQRYGRALRAGAITVNEYREAVGLDRIEDGDIYYVPQGSRVVPEGELEDAAGASAPEPEPEPEPDGEERSGRRATLARALEDGDVERLRRRLARAIEGVYGAQAEAIAEKLAATLDPDELVDLTVEAARMAEAVAPYIEEILYRQGELVAAQLDGEFDREDPEVAEYLAAAPVALGLATARTTRELLRGALQDASSEEAEEIARRVREIIAARDRADLAAETETVRTANRAARFAYAQNGIQRVRWRITSAEPCEFCRAMEGRTVGVREAFAELGATIAGADGGEYTVGYETVETPPLHPRCGCYLEEVV